MPIFELAYHLHLTAYDIMYKMTYEEFIKWNMFFDRRPIGWREDDRTAKLLQAQGVKAKPTEIFPSLKQLYQSRSDMVGRAGFISKQNLKGSALFSRLLTAVGGDKLKALEDEN